VTFLIALFPINSIEPMNSIETMIAQIRILYIYPSRCCLVIIRGKAVIAKLRPGITIASSYVRITYHHA